jgi:cytochrome b6-f complex iron-sulfur subunit
MADKKKMSVAEMLAAARKADSQGGAEAATPAANEPAAASEASAAKPLESIPADNSAQVGGGGAARPTKPVAKPAAGGRPSVADMLAMARAGKAGTPAAPEAAAPLEKVPPAPKPKPAAAAAKMPAAGAAGPAAPRDTASILASARKKERPGPITKAEAAAKTQAAVATIEAKPRIIVPPMPAKPDYAKRKPAVAKTQAVAKEQPRRDFFATMLAVGFWMLGGVSALWTLLTVKFMFPNVLREPPSKFKVGFPDAFPPGQVQEKFKAQYGIWIVNTEYNGQPEIFALKSVCTHLGCTPNWLEAEQKFKCPCHGSGFYKDGINFEGPAPRPLERYAIRLADDGQIEVDKSKTFQEEMGAWTDPSCFIPV